MPSWILFFIQTAIESYFRKCSFVKEYLLKLLLKFWFFLNKSDFFRNCFSWRQHLCIWDIFIYKLCKILFAKSLKRRIRAEYLILASQPKENSVHNHSSMAFLSNSISYKVVRVWGSFQQLPPPPLVPSRESPPLLCYTLPRYYLAYSLDSRIIV